MYSGKLVCTSLIGKNLFKKIMMIIITIDNNFSLHICKQIFKYIENVHFFLRGKYMKKCNALDNLYQVH